MPSSRPAMNKTASTFAANKNHIQESDYRLMGTNHLPKLSYIPHNTPSSAVSKELVGFDLYLPSIVILSRRFVQCGFWRCSVHRKLQKTRILRLLGSQVVISLTCVKSARLDANFTLWVVLNPKTGDQACGVVFDKIGESSSF